MVDSWKRFFICFFCILFVFYSGGIITSYRSNSVYASDTSSNTSSDSGMSEDDKGFFGELIGGLLDGLKNLFVPSEDFFDEFNTKIMTTIDKKTGGLTKIFADISTKFEHLKTCTCKSSPVTLKIPDNHLYPGYKGIEADVLKSGNDGFKFLKGFITAFVVVITVFGCYKKLIKLFHN